MSLFTRLFKVTEPSPGSMKKPLDLCHEWNRFCNEPDVANLIGKAPLLGGRIANQEQSDVIDKIKENFYSCYGNPHITPTKGLPEQYAKIFSVSGQLTAIHVSIEKRNSGQVHLMYCWTISTTIGVVSGHVVASRIYAAKQYESSNESVMFERRYASCNNLIAKNIGDPVSIYGTCYPTSSGVDFNKDNGLYFTISFTAEVII